MPIGLHRTYGARHLYGMPGAVKGSPDYHYGKRRLRQIDGRIFGTAEKLQPSDYASNISGNG